VPVARRGGRFVCCMALAFPDETTKTFFGFSEGHIGLEPKGKTGFGYDPVFIPKGFEKTFAEMTGNEKDKLSHRGKAIELTMKFLHSQLHL
jgi:XTP/dITP diphosphohydrolase